MERKQRSDKGKRRVDHSGFNRVYSFKLNSRLEPQAVERVDSLIAQHGTIQNAMRFLITGQESPPVMNPDVIDDKLTQIMQAIANLRAAGGSSKGATAKQKATVINAVKNYCDDLSDFFS